MNQLGDLFPRARLLLALFAIGMTGFGFFGMTYLEFENSPRSVFRSRDSDFTDLEKLFQEFGSDDNDCIVVLQAQDLFTAKTIAALRQIAREIGQTAGVATVQSLADAVEFGGGRLPRSLLPPPDAPAEAYVEAKSAALSHPLLKDQLISADAKTTLMIVRLEGGDLSIDVLAPILTEIRQKSRRIAEPVGLEVMVTGIPSVRVDILSTLRRDQFKFLLLGTLSGIAVASVLFRRISAVVIVIAAPILAVIWTMGILGFVGERINVFNSMLPTLVMVIAFADAVHIMVDIRRARSEGIDRITASATALNHLAGACMLTSLTTAVGFGSLVSAKVEMIQRFGLYCALGTSVALLTVLVVVPLLASTRLGENISLPRHHGLGPRLGFLEAIVMPVIHYPKVFAIAGTVITLAMAASSIRLYPDSQLTETVPTWNESFQGLQHCDEAFGGVLATYVVFEWPESTTVGSAESIELMRQVEEILDKEGLTCGPLSILNVLRALPGDGDLSARARMIPFLPKDLVRRFLREDLRQALVSARVKDLGTAALQPVYLQLDQNLQRLVEKYPGFKLKLTGTTVVACRNINQMISDLASSLALAAVLIFGVMTLAFRSVTLGLIGVIPNVFPLAFTAFFLVVTGRPLQFTSVIVFSICLGIAVDDTIHFLTRFRREWTDPHDVRGAIIRTFAAVGVAILTTTVVLLAGFGAAMFSDIPTSRLFASLSCMALAAALVGDMLILPALLLTVLPRVTAGQQLEPFAPVETAPNPQSIE